MLVVAIIALLIAILPPSLGKVRETTRRTACGTNLKGLGSSVAIYAAQSSDNLPQHASGGYWPWDIAVQTCEALLSSAVANNNSLRPDSVRKLFCCPSNVTRNTTLGTGNLQDLWIHDANSSGTSGSHVIGYGWKGWPASSHYGSASGWPATNQWDSVMQSQPPRASPQIAMSKARPAGGNILAMDSHVEWRPFSTTTNPPRANRISFNRAIWFWWPSPVR